jgi:membrane-associated phospholipid phosphatase
MKPAPTHFDIWFMVELARFVGRYPLFDRAVQSAIAHNVLGGLGYSIALFVFWIEAERTGKEATRQRILTTLLGSILAITLTILAGKFLSWLPPARNPIFAGFYAKYFGHNPNTNCFPSQSTAVYSAVAAGIYSLCRSVGLLLWVGIAVAVALPRLYVGGHYPTDILVGCVLGLTGYLISRHVLEMRLISRLESLFIRGSPLRIFTEVLVFCWILQVAVEFRDVVWLKNCLDHFIG